MERNCKWPSPTYAARNDSRSSLLQNHSTLRGALPDLTPTPEQLRARHMDLKWRRELQGFKLTDLPACREALPNFVADAQEEGPPAEEPSLRKESSDEEPSLVPKTPTQKQRTAFLKSQEAHKHTRRQRTLQQVEEAQQKIQTLTQTLMGQEVLWIAQIPGRRDRKKLRRTMDRQIEELRRLEEWQTETKAKQKRVHELRKRSAHRKVRSTHDVYTWKKDWTRP